MTDVADLYLSLLKKALTRYEMEGEWRYEPYHPDGSGFRDLLRRVAQTTVRQKGLELVHRVRIDLALREEGYDWPQTAETMIGLARLNQLQSAIEDVISQRIPGDLIETGVWRGGASIFMRGVLAAYQVTDRTIWVADSFEGLPKPSTDYPDYVDEGMAFWGVPTLAVSMEEVRTNFARYGLLDDQVRFLKGWFKDTLAIAPIERLAILRMDGDLYESTIQSLEALYGKVSDGGYVIVDDYRTVTGCRDAINDFRRDHGVNEPKIDIDYASVYWQVNAASVG